MDPLAWVVFDRSPLVVLVQVSSDQLKRKQVVSIHKDHILVATIRKQSAPSAFENAARAMQLRMVMTAS